MRLTESQRISLRYPERCPIVIGRLNGGMGPKIKKHKYMVPRNLTIGQLIYVIKKQVQVSHEQAIFFFIKESIPLTSALVGNIFDKEKDDDGFLYIFYSTENTFGYGSFRPTVT